MVSFEIGSQNAGSIQNVGGDLSIGHLHVEAAWSAEGLRRELTGLEDQLAAAQLPAGSREAAEGAVAAARAEAAGEQPDPARIGLLLQRAAHVLADTGALSTAGAGLVESLRRTALVLGPAGKALLMLLPLL